MGLWSKIGEKGSKVTTAPLSSTKKWIGYDQARDNLDWMQGLAGKLMPSSIKAGRVETFENAMARQDVTQENLKRIYINHIIRFWLSSFLFIVGLMLGTSYIVAGSFFAIFPLIGFSAVCLSQMFSGSFRAHQLASRKFCDVSEWISRRDVWIPLDFSLPPPPFVKKSNTIVVSNPAARRPQVEAPSKKE